jgi:hypothetical protein
VPKLTEIPWQVPATLALSVVLIVLVLGLAGFEITGVTATPIGLSRVDSSQPEKESLMADIICGAAYSGGDMGAAYRIRDSNTSCSKFCNAFEDNHACSGFLLIESDLRHTALASCDTETSARKSKEATPIVAGRRSMLGVGGALSCAQADASALALRRRLAEC